MQHFFWVAKNGLFFLLYRRFLFFLLNEPIWNGLPYPLCLCMTVSLKIISKMLLLNLFNLWKRNLEGLHCTAGYNKAFFTSSEDRTHSDQMKYLEPSKRLSILRGFANRLGTLLSGKTWEIIPPITKAMQCSSKTPKVCSSPVFYDFIIQPHWRALTPCWKVCEC